ncbi:MAG: AMP-binding protein [Planctomycetota bacterium]
MAENQTDAIAALNEMFVSESAANRWVGRLTAAREQSLNPAGLRQLHTECFAGEPEPHPIWYPELLSTTSNCDRWREAIGLNSYDEFYQWTISDRESFWRQSVERLGIQFDRPATATLDESRGPAHAAWFPDSRLNITNSCFQADPDSLAIICQQPDGPLRTWTVKELQQNASRVANGLVDAGFKIGDAIGVFMPMTDWSVAIYLGVVMAGCHVVSIADSFAPPEIETRLRIANAKAVFTYDFQIRSGKKLPLFRRLVEAGDVPAIVIAQNGTLEVDLRKQDIDWDELIVDRNEFEPVSACPQETINVLFSSGTTGDPKAIPWNQLTPIKCAIDGYCHQNIVAGDVCAWPTNLGWMMGPWLIFASLINRATIAIYEDAPMGPGFGQFVQDAGVTMLGVVPTIVKAWQSTACMEPFDWSGIKVFSSTGESSQVAPMKYLSSLAGFKPIIEYCGGTEIGGGYVSSVVDKPNVPAAFNTAAVGLEFVLISEMNDTETDSQPTSKQANEGEIFLVPPSIGLSNRLINRDHFETYYANTPVLSGYSQLRRHGDYFRELKTGFGSVFVAGGRIDDTMNLGGIKISSAEIERVLNQCERVIETAAVAEARGDGPDQLVVFAVCEPTVSLERSIDTKTEPVGETPPEIAAEIESLQREMNTRLKQELNPLFRISRLAIVDQLPRTASGKVMRRMLRSSNECSD